MKKVLLAAMLIIGLVSAARAAVTVEQGGKSFNRISTTAVDVTGSNSSDSIDISAYAMGTVQIVWADHTSGGSTVTSSFKLQSSVDAGANWDDISWTTTTTSGTSGSESFSLSPIPGQLIRLTVSGTAAAGTLTPYMILKKSMANN